jgi:hypothetical protein
MRRTLAMFAMTCLTVACGAKTLDLGGVEDGGATYDEIDGATSNPPFGPTNSEVILAKQLNAARLTLHEGWLYWLAFLYENGAVLHRCRANDCVNTIESLLPNTSRVQLLGERMYLTAGGKFVSCPIDDCSAPTEIGASNPTIHAMRVDASGIYWAATGETAIYTCPLTGCATPERMVVGGVSAVELTSDDTHLYYVAEEHNSTVFSVQSAPKDGSALPKIIVANLKNLSVPRVHAGFVYWSNPVANGYIARCPVTGCIDGKPEILAKDQPYPFNVEPIDDAVYWLNERAAITGNPTVPATVHGCNVTRCASTIAMLDAARAPAHVSVDGMIRLSAPTLAQNLVADANSVYYIGDSKVERTDSSRSIDVTSAIRRLPRKPFD